MDYNTYIECLENVVGISHPSLCPSECLPAGPGLVPSESGFYLNGFDEGSIKLLDAFNASNCDSSEF